MCVKTRKTRKSGNSFLSHCLTPEQARTVLIVFKDAYISMSV